MKNFTKALLLAFNLITTVAIAQVITGSNYAGANFTPANGSILSGSFTNIGTFKIAAGTTVYVSPGTILSIQASDIVIDGTLQGKGAGYAGGASTTTGGANGLPGSGPGAGKGGLYGGCVHGDGGSGAGYGGAGGSSGSYFGSGPAAVSGGVTYGSSTAYNVQMGSGGGAGANYCAGYNGYGGAGGAGGAGIYLASNTIVLSSTGVINADGNNGQQGSTSTYNATSSGGGGGSGGTIEINAASGTIAGTLSAMGGNGYGALTIDYAQGGGGGGGGRIKVAASAVVLGSAVITYNGGTAGLSSGSVKPQAGQPGTSSIVGTPAGALDFQGTDDYVDLGTPLAANASYTKEGWVYNNNPSFANNNLFSNYNDPVYIPGGYLNVGQGGNYGVLVDPDPFPTNAWTHVAVTYDQPSNTLKLYINGILKASTNNAPAFMGGTMYLGKHPVGGGKSAVSMDEVRLWNRALTSCEILANMNCELPNPATQNGLVRYYKFNQGFVNANNTGITTITDASANNVAGTLTGFTLTGTTSNFIAGQVTGTCAVYTIPTSPITGTTTACMNGTTTLSNSKTGGVWSSSNPAVASVNPQTGVVTGVGVGSATLTYTNPCNGVSTTTVTVAALPSANITPAGATSFCTGGNVVLSAATYALRFNGSNNTVKVSNGYASTDEITYEATVTPAAFTAGGFNVIVNHDNYNTGAIHFQFANGALQFSVAGNAPNDQYATYTFAAGTTYNIAAVYSKSGKYVKFYVNGVLTNTANYASTVSIIGNNAYYIGSWNGNSRYFNGTIDNIRIWNIQRTDAQIQAAANSVPVSSGAAGLIRYYRFDEGTGTTTADNAGNGTGVLVNNPVWVSTTPGGLSYAWTPGGATAQNITVNNTGNYTVTVTNANNCSVTSDPVAVTVDPLPAVTLAAVGGTTACPGTAVTLNAATTGSISSYQWTKNGIVIPGASASSYAAASTGTYGVTVFTAGGCQSSSNTINITIQDITPPVFTGQPAVTTPANPDGSIYATSANGAVVTFTLPSATDDCSGSNVTVVATPASGSVFPIGITQVTYVATDGVGLQTTGTFSVTVAGLLPSVNCPANITVNTAPGQCGANVNFAATETTGIPASTITYSENGNPVTPGSFFSTGIHTIVANAVNVVGGSTCSFTITVLDKEPPVLVGVPESVTVECDAVPVPAVVTASDNCSAGTPVFTETRTDGSNANNYTLTRTWTVTDASENTATATQVITVRDTKAPVISNIPQDMVVNNDAGKCGALINFAATATDNCSPVTIAYSQNPGTLFAVGTTEVIITATDISGNSSTARFTIKVNDTEKPLVKAPGAYSVPNNPGNCGATINNIGTPETSDNCGVASISNDHPSSFYPVGTTIVTWTVTDIHGNVTDTARQSVTVYDMQLPVISVTDITRNADLNQCGANIGLSRPETGDNCGVASVTNNHPSAFYAVGTTDVTWTVTDIHGNQATVIQHVTVKDVQAPKVITKNIVVPLDAAGHVTITPAQVDNGSNDNCSPVTLSFITGASTGTICATANEGGSLTLTAPAGAVITGINFASYGTPNGSCGNFTIGGCNAPGSMNIVAGYALGKNSVVIPANNSIFGDPCYGTYKRLYVQATYTLAGAGSSTVSSLNFDCNSTGNNTVILQAVDSYGNTSITTAVVTVKDVTPAIVSTQNISVNLDATGNVSITPAMINNGSNDNCGIASLSLDKTVFNCSNVGDNTVTLTVTDVHGNVSSATAVVTVKDVTPAIVSTQNISVNLDATGNVSITPAMINNGSSDNCGIASLSLDKTSLNCSNVGDNVVTLTVTDVHGNISSATATVTVRDVIPATVITQNITVNLDAAGNAIIMPAMIDNGSSDNCGIASFVLDKTNFNCGNVGDNTVTLTVTDVHGNESSATAMVTVKDQTPPTINVPADQVICANANGSNTYTIPAATSIADNCSVATVVYSVAGPISRNGSGADASGAFGIGTSTITWTVTDVNGNSTTVSSKVTINPLPAASFVSSNADAFCNSVTLTGSSSINAASYSWSSVNTPGNFSSNPLLTLGLTNADGNYYLYVKANATGCVSATAAVYNYQKQNVVSSYTLLAFKEVELGKYNKVATGSVGVMSAKGEASFNSNTSVNGPGAFVKAPKIDKDGSGIQIPVQIIGTATVTLPTMQYNTAVTNNLPSYTASVNNTTVGGNFKNLNVKKGISLTVTGNTFGNIRLEEGASIRFVSNVVNIENFTADKGWKNTDYSYIRFAPNTSVRVSNKMSLGSQVYFNPEGNKVTVYMGDSRSDEEKFTVKGGDTRVIANIYMPNGKLRVTATDADDDHDNCDHKAHNAKDCKHKGHDHNDCDHKGHAASNCSDDVYMTGLFIAEEIESKGNTVIWNSYDCAAPPAPVNMMNATTGKQATATAEVVETKTATTEEELKVTVMPNPSTTYFTLKLESRKSEPVNLRVMDGSGRVIDAKSKLAPNGTIQVGHNYSSGTYYAELLQGTTRKVIQLIKGRG